MAEAPKWLQVMRASSGIIETPGAADNPKIMAMADEIATAYPEMTNYCAQYTHDSIPWCGLAAAYCMSESGIRPPFGKTDTDKFLWARAWDHADGFPEIDTPRLGCVVVLERTGGGHVTFYERTEGNYYVCTGGNQSDKINTASFPIANVVALTWPGEVGPPPPAERRELEEGDTGPDVAALQTAIGLPPDGEFGPVTETQVMAFQAACGGIDVDGVVGDQTWAEVDDLLARMAAGSTGLSEELEAEIIRIAEDSALADYSWPDRGKPPPGYVSGLALCFAVACREYVADGSAMTLAAAGESGNTEKDALAYLANEFRAIGMNNTQDGLATLRGLFVLLIGLGMRESSGRCYEGRDLSATNVTADTCEAGLFQTSWNIRAASNEIPPLLPTYWDDPQGFLDVFNEDLNPTVNNLKCYGTGDGARYQWLARYSPLFATMVTAVGARVLRKHWGPINRKEVTLRPEADVLLLAVQHLALAQPPEPVEPPIVPGEPAEVTIVIRSKGAVKVTVFEEEPS